MSKNALVIVESPAKARTIGRFLGGKAQVQACMGHIRDLPENSLGVSIDEGFKPTYELTPNGKKTMGFLRQALGSAKDIYLATDPDREGEAIAWHLKEVLRKQAKGEFHRVSFHEITKQAIEHAFNSPGELDLAKVDAQQARRVLDRIVGYKVSPLLWKEVRKGTSAGRVQSVALRLVCERERAIMGFVPEEYWNLDAHFLAAGTGTRTFKARLHRLDGAKPQVGCAELANELADELAAAAFKVAKVDEEMKQQRPPPPFITSTLQQAASSSLRLGAKQAMRLAQELYEGVEIGTEGLTGLITYMRTDSVEVAKEAQEAARSFIASRFGQDFVPARPNVYRSRQGSQGAHECIRPTAVERTPEAVEKFLSPQQLRLYRLIWNRFTASQMAAASIRERSAEVAAEGQPRALKHEYSFRAVSRDIVFQGYLQVYNIADTEDDEAGEGSEYLPELQSGQACALDKLDREQCFTEPPRRFSEATLVRQLELSGVGRPSTYASIVSTIQERQYVENEKRRLVPTELGFQVNDYLVKCLPELFDVGFTARMEESLDQIEAKNVAWGAMLEDFYKQFSKWLSDSGTAAISTDVPNREKVGSILALFPADLQWQEPVKRGARVYDDRKFFESLGAQVEGGKALSEKQWRALLQLACRYADALPGLEEAAAAVGAKEYVREAISKIKSAPGAAEAVSAADGKAAAQPEVEEIVAALEKVSWEKPVRRGRRVYDDKKFFESLRQQAAEGRQLSPPQLMSIRKMLVKYRGQVPEFAALTARLGISVHPDLLANAEAVDSNAAELVELISQIKDWQPAVQKGARTYDDAKFAASIVDQFKLRRAISDKQQAALRSLIGRYKEQISGYAELAPRLQLPMETAESGKEAAAPMPEVKCPKCAEGVMVQRKGRGRTFWGCSAYPKCRHTTNSQPTSTPAEA